MTIGFILNGEDVIVECGPDLRLIDILKDKFSLHGAKAGCYMGHCGACTVIFNGEIVNSCLIPAFRIRNSEIITIEGISQTDEYQDIILGFTEAGLENCGFCNTGKILAAEALLGRNSQPTTDEIHTAFQGIKCRCTDSDELIQAVMAVAENRMRRLNG